ncbi:hypothetical protein RHAL1_03330 [Beijerinckiaceae bacterium RH AL1]|nr:hypothetical protein [Beijerinckiaceae bacterium]VVB48454.1 hypothetical protein RHCH11_RHCH11_03264 [Beijerinckiaceae bacterium RH CH11]VVB48536.1 hypothetical protein RHAL8_03260 [Beijerinckiaceae bacterium RH AL8]VVC56403.1 hypothetical protein RHAL1_03330 [Beijerinckiaceae bacterium RH AL1]
MSELLERAVATLRALPADTQDEIASLVLSLAGADQQLVDLTPDDDAALARSEAAAARGEFATDDQIAAIWAKHGL